MAVVTGKLVQGRLFRTEARSIRRRVPITSGALVSKAWLTIKNSPSDSDPGVLQKTITNTPSADGHIEETGSSGKLFATLRFDLSSSDTALLTANLVYYYDIKIRFVSGNVEVIEYGMFSPEQPITQATT